MKSVKLLLIINFLNYLSLVVKFYQLFLIIKCRCKLLQKEESFVVIVVYASLQKTDQKILLHLLVKLCP